MTKTEAYQDCVQFLALTKKNGWDAGTLYALKPTNAAGDFVWTRSSAQNRINQAGATELMAINVPRVDYSNTCPELLIEDGGSWKDIAYNTTIAYGLKGTIFIRARIFESASPKVDTLFSLNDESLDDYIVCSTNASRDIFIETMGGAIDSNAYNFNLASDGIYSVAIGYDFTGANNNLNIAINGVLERANASQTNNPPTALSRFDLGSLFGTNIAVDNRIIGMMYFADQLSDTDLTALTVQ
jgi:hypothetical protein